MSTKRSTIKNDPFALVVPDSSQQEDEPETAPASPPRSREQGRGVPEKPIAKPPANKKEKITVHLTHDLIERVKNAAYWNPRLTIASIAEMGIAQVIEQVERENGGPYPARDAELKGGRPIGSTSTRKTS